MTFVTFIQASPLPQAAHIGVSWAERVTQANQEVKKQQDGGALHGRHGPERKRTFTDGCKNPNISQRKAHS